VALTYGGDRDRGRDDLLQHLSRTRHVLVRQRAHVERGEAVAGMTLNRRPALITVGEIEVRRMEFSLNIFP